MNAAVCEAVFHAFKESSAFLTDAPAVLKPRQCGARDLLVTSGACWGLKVCGRALKARAYGVSIRPEGTVTQKPERVCVTVTEGYEEIKAAVCELSSMPWLRIPALGQRSLQSWSLGQGSGRAQQGTTSAGTRGGKSAVVPWESELSSRP